MGCVALNFSCDGVVNGIVRCFRGKGYIRNLKKNLRALEREMIELKAIQHEVQNKIAREKETGDRQTLEIVQVWLTRIEIIDTRFSDLHSVSPIELQKLCLFDKCSINGCSSYKYGKKVYLLLEDVKKLKLEGNFEVVSEPAPRSVVEERPIGDTVGQEKMLETAWNRLMEKEVGIMGLHGMGGVGKTTLFKTIHNKFAEKAGEFDTVMWIVVSRGREISMLQDDIAQKLQLCDDMWMIKNESDKAAKIHTVLKKKRFVLMLDDIWEKVHLDAIGVPSPTIKNKCKVAFTTRSREVCGRMGDHKPMEVKCLEKDEAWKLFQKKAGDNTTNPLIVEFARKIAEKCQGLPLALSVIGETMSSITEVHEWELALDVLTRTAADFPDMETKILPVLKFSYDSLAGEHIQSCFLYFALFPETYVITKEELIDYWICEEFIEEDQNLKRARNKGYGVLGTLIRANLLTADARKVVLMHDVVREMALWIASDFGKQKETFVVHSSVGLHEVPIIRDCGAVRRMSLMHNNIKEITYGSEFPQLKTMFLQGNKLKNLSSEFIQSIGKLAVLDLARNTNFREIPEKISELASLQYLNLSYTLISQLPVGIQELKKLTHMNLTCTVFLRSIRGISKLSSLKILKLVLSKAHIDVESVKELQLLEQLQFLTISISTELGLQMISGDEKLARCIESLHISEIEQIPFGISLLVNMVNLCWLLVDYCHVWDLSDLHKSTFPSFANLYFVMIRYCNSIEDLTWLQFAPNLVSLDITGARDVREIINEEKAIGFGFTGSTPFQKLEYMSLRDVPKLESIYGTHLPFPSLKHMRLECPKLKKLPFDATSVQRIDKFKLELPEEQENNLEWEDEDTKNRILPSLKQTLEWDHNRVLWLGIGHR